jgi:tRNA dimethylallyltransferase
MNKQIIPWLITACLAVVLVGYMIQNINKKESSDLTPNWNISYATGPHLYQQLANSFVFVIKRTPDAVSWQNGDYGEIVNADARQLYRGFDIGTGKPSFEERTGVPHYLFDEDPAQQISVSEWKEKALACIREIVSRGRLPILVGGTGLYVQALVDNFSIPEVAPQVELRDELSSLSLEALVKRLEEVDPDALEIVDLKNPRRVIRALEVALTTGRSFVDARQKGESLVDALQLGIVRSREDLYARSEAAFSR